MTKGIVKEKVLTNIDELIQDANRQIDEAKLRIAALRKAVKGFEELKKVPGYGQAVSHG